MADIFGEDYMLPPPLIEPAKIEKKNLKIEE